MKFTDGNWLVASGVTPHHPAEAYDISTEGDALVVTAPTRPIRHRGDTLQGPVLTIRLSSPLENVIRVRIEHYTGFQERDPKIPLAANPAPKVEITHTTEASTLRSGSLTARVARGEKWELSFWRGERQITRSGFRGIGYIQHATQGAFVHEQLSLGVGECVYGFGERFTAFAKNGQVVETWNKDGGTSSDQAYKCVPFYLTNRGYGVLVNETGPVSFEVASEKLARVGFSLPGESLEYFIIDGPTPKDVVRRLTALTGRPALPPAWSFGLWLTTSFTTNYDEATVTSFIDGMKERNLPLHVFHFDCFWMREFDWCNFEWDARVFPDPKSLLKRLHERGLKVCVWINPYIAQRSQLFAEGKQHGYLLKKPNGDVWQTDLWQPGMGIVDFTNPAACEWYASKLRALLEMGVDSFKTDFGERIPTDVVYHDGSDPLGMHNFYPILYNEVVFRLLQEVRGEGEAVLFARSSYASGQRLPVHWGGDCDSTFESMAESLRGGLSLSLCGFGYWSHDIGGFEGLPRASIYKRWIAFGLLSSHSRLHGSSSYRVPWHYNCDAVDVLRHFTQLKCRLMPYLYAAAVEAHREGVPMMRAMVLEFPDDPASDTLERQYLLGPSLLVAPVMTENGEVDFYLPAGRWTHFLSGDVREGGRWHRERYDFLSLPLFVRPGTILPIGAVADRPDYDYAAGVTFKVYEPDALPAETQVLVPDSGGRTDLTLTVRRRDARVTIAVDNPHRRSWQLRLASRTQTLSVVGGTATSDSDGVLISPAADASSLEFSL
jgi:alpha-D-xyloside xylohydrolase